MQATADVTTRPLLRMRGICKSFPGVRALHGVDLEVQAGKVLALLGENGAGKSTLIKVLGGAHRPDEGTIELDGLPLMIGTPMDAMKAGIGIIYQEFNLVPTLTVWENVFLGREETRRGFIRRGAERKRVAELFDRIGVRIPIDAPCGRLSVAHQQLVEIVRVLSQDVKLIVMDEPSAALTPAEVERLFSIVEELKAQGIGIVYISHRLDEVFEIADDVTVLRDGEHIATHPIGELDRDRVIELMVGRSIDNEFPKHHHEVGDVRLRVSGLTRGRAVQRVSFDVRAGEVLGVTGLVGAGRTETVRMLFGADQCDAGIIELDGCRLRIRKPRDAIRQGICLLTEDRKSQGLIAGLTVRENFGLPNLSELASMGFVNRKKERQALGRFVDSLQIKIPHQEQLAKNLSGGNQQKVVLAKWLERNAEVVIFDEPTRGIDVGAKYEIYLLINDLAKAGKAIIMVSSELPEVLGMSDRIMVMHEGRVTGMIDDVESATQEQIMRLAIG